MVPSGTAWSPLSCGRFTVTLIGLKPLDADLLTNRWSQPLTDAMRVLDFMKTSLMFATLAAASGGSAPSR